MHLVVKEMRAKCSLAEGRKWICCKHRFRLSSKHSRAIYMETMLVNEGRNADFERAVAKWESVKSGAINVIVDDQTLDILSEHFKDDDGVEADVYFKHTSSPKNPDQVGIRDAYILTLSQKGKDILDSIPQVGMKL